MDGAAAALRAEPPSAGRKALVAVNLELSDDEASRFWPIYDRYQQEIQAIGDRLTRVIQDYTASFRDLSNEKAMKLMEEYLAVEADRVKVRRAYIPEFAKILPGRTVARLYQIENFELLMHLVALVAVRVPSARAAIADPLEVTMEEQGSEDLVG